ncbi:MAG: hypothetical protein PVI24_10205 [Myxococcales bacterium]
MTRPPLKLVLAASFLVFAVFGCNSDSAPDGPALSARFEIQASDIVRVEWEVSGGGLTDPIAGLAEVTGGTNPTVAVTIMDLPVATGYGIVLIAYDASDNNICRGSAPFDVAEGVTTNINLTLTCSVSSDLPSGSVGVTATFQDNICPVINQLNVVPQTIAVGQTAQVSVNATDAEGATLQYTWDSLAGTFGDPTAASTTYTCTQAIDHNISINVSDGDTFCDQSRLLNVTCVADACASTTCDDGNQCTDDGVCDPVSGCPGSTNTAAGAACDFASVGDGLCDGAGTCVECLTTTDCTNDGNECTTGPSCTAGTCDTPTPLASGTTCSAGFCDGAGACVGCLSATDCTDDGNECTTGPSCTAGTCDTATPLASGTTCSGGVCNGSGLCVECVAGTDCPDDGNECTTAPSCTAGACDAQTPLASGTTCSAGVCDGSGACVGCVSPTDCADDGNECTTNTCVLNACGVVNVADGTVCSTGTCQTGVCTP